MTITEKILANHAGRKRVEAGEQIWIDADVLMTHDVCGPGTFAIFQKEFGQSARVWNPEKIIIIPDHFIYTQDAQARENVNTLDRFATQQKIRHYHKQGAGRDHGVCHIILASEGHNRPGSVLFGTDSHTCTAGAFGMFATGIGNTDAAFVMGTGKLWVKVPETIRLVFKGNLPNYLMAKDLILEVLGRIGVDGASYMAMEFSGPVVEALSMPERMTLCNMAIEAGGKTGIVKPDDVTKKFLQSDSDDSYEWLHTDPDAAVAKEIIFDTGRVEPKVALPHSPGHVKSVTEVIGRPIDCCYIGSCTGGKTEDFLRAARLLKGRTVKITTNIVPATQSVADDLHRMKIDDQTIADIFLSAGAQIGPPSCAACLGGPPDTFGRLEGRQTCISTTNRNFPGRMGSPDSSVVLASPLTVAATAIAGHLQDPRNYME